MNAVLAPQEYFENVNCDELAIGQSSRMVRTLTLSDIQIFAAVTGDVNPVHVDARCALAPPPNGVAAHAMWGGTLISSLPLRVGDKLTVVATVIAKEDAAKRVSLDCQVSNQTGATVLSGTVVVLAPAKKVRRPAVQVPHWSNFDPQARLEALLASVRHLVAVRCAVVHPCDAESLRGALDAARHGLIIPILIGPELKIRGVAKAIGLDLAGVHIEPVEHSVAAAERAVELALSGEADIIMKGSLHTDELMHAVVGSRAMRTARRLSHVFRFDVPMYDKPLLLSDAALNIHPTLEEKADIIQNAVTLAHALGVERPNVAILAALETVNVKMQSTIDAAALCKMADRGQIKGANLDGPLAFDNAISMEAVRIKGIDSTVAGNADILIVPDLESGNLLAKQLEYLAGATTCGVVLGARVPIALTSRADSASARVSSAALALLLAHHYRKAQP